MKTIQQTAYEYNYIMNLISHINNKYRRSYWGIRCYGSGARYLRQLTNAIKNCAKRKDILEIIHGHAENPYMFQIYNVTNTTIYFRVASTVEYHKHKRGQYYHYGSIPISQFKMIFEAEVFEIKRQRLEQLKLRRTSLNHELYSINKEIEEIRQFLE